MSLLDLLDDLFDDSSNLPNLENACSRPLALILGVEDLDLKSRSRSLEFHCYKQFTASAMLVEDLPSTVSSADSYAEEQLLGPVTMRADD